MMKQDVQFCDVSHTEPNKPQIHHIREIKNGLGKSITDKNEKDEIKFYSSSRTKCKREKQKKSSCFMKQKIFLQMICPNRLDQIILVISILFAIANGCSMSLVVVLCGRIKHILLNTEPTTPTFFQGACEQVVVLASVAIFAIVTNFVIQMSITVLSDKISLRLKRRFNGLGSRKCNQPQLRREIDDELSEKIELMLKGLASFEMMFRTFATIILSLIICFYHEIHLTVFMIAIIPSFIALHVVSKRFSRKSTTLQSIKFFQAMQMEKEMLLLKLSDDNITNDERLMKFSVELRNNTRNAIVDQVWKSSYYGMLRFVEMTFVGCGLLYGSYLIDKDTLIREGDIFIVVLSIALTATNISPSANHYKAFNKGVYAALFIKKLEQLESGLLLIRNGHQQDMKNDVIDTLLAPLKCNKTAAILSTTKNSFIRFANGTKSVLHNYHNHKLFLLLGHIVAIINGLEQPAYNIVMGQVFIAMLSNLPNNHDFIFCAIQFSATGFCIFMSRTVSTILATIASEHMAVSFRVILTRKLLKRIGRRLFSKPEINNLVNENISVTSEAKSLYYPHATELISCITSVIANIIIAFIFSWEIALLGLLFTMLCLLTQLELTFEVLHQHCRSPHQQHFVQRSNESLKQCQQYVRKAANISIMQICAVVLKTMCYALTAYVCNHGYKHPEEAFLSVITSYSAIQDAMKLPKLFVKLRKSWLAVSQIYACMYDEPPTHNIQFISESVKS